MPFNSRVMVVSSTIVIVNWNGRHLLPECLEGLRNQQYQGFSTVLVDNGSSDGSIDYVAGNHPEVKIIGLPRNIGFPAANNIALKGLRTEYVALLNNDAIPDPLWLMNLLKAMERYPEAGFVASKMLFNGNRGVIDRAGDSYTRAGVGHLRGRGAPAEHYDEQEWIFGACAGAALYRGAMLEKIGLFDEDFFLIYEDVDLSFRAQLMGYRCLYVPEAVVYHRGSSSLVHDSPVSVYYGHRNLEWVYLQNMPELLIRKTVGEHVIYGIGAFLFFASKGRVKDFIKAKLHALKGLKTSLRKRRRIQAARIVTDAYIWSLLERERFLPRLAMRFEGSNTAGK